VSSPVTKLDLAFTFVLEHGELRILLEYCTALYRRSTAERMVGHLIELFGGVAEAPETAIIQLRLSAAGADGTPTRAAASAGDDLADFNF
jgi:hypothetical protein